MRILGKGAQERRLKAPHGSACATEHKNGRWPAWATACVKEKGAGGDQLTAAGGGVH